MKKFYIALLFAASSLALQTASAATLTLTNITPGSTSSSGVIDGTGPSVEGAFSGVSVWEVALSNLGPSGLADLDFDIHISGVPTVFSSFFNVDPLTSLTAGSYFLTIVALPNTISYDFTISATNVPLNDVPVPAAIWLFGSALLGLAGMGRRKSQAGVAA